MKNTLNDQFNVVWSIPLIIGQSDVRVRSSYQKSHRSNTNNDKKKRTLGSCTFLGFTDRMGIYCCFEIVYKMQISKALDCNVLGYMLVSRFIAKFFKYANKRSTFT